MDAIEFMPRPLIVLGLLAASDLICVSLWWWLEMVGRAGTLNPGPSVTIWSRRHTQRTQFGSAALTWVRIQRPLVLRALGAARLVLRQPTGNSKFTEVMPAAPLAESLRVAERLVTDPALVTTAVGHEPVLTPRHLLVLRRGGGRDIIQRDSPACIDLSWRRHRPHVIAVRTPWGRVYRGPQEPALALAGALCPALLVDDYRHTEPDDATPNLTTPITTTSGVAPDIPPPDTSYSSDPARWNTGPDPGGEIDTAGPW